MEEQNGAIEFAPDVELTEEKAETPVHISMQPVQILQFPDAKTLRSHIFQKQDLREDILVIPEWDCELKIKALTGKQRAKVMQACIRPDGTPDIEKMYALMVINCTRHPITDELIFTPVDQKALMEEKSGGVIERIAMKASQISGLEQGAQQQLEKNSKMGSDAYILK